MVRLLFRIFGPGRRLLSVALASVLVVQIASMVSISDHLIPAQAQYDPLGQSEGVEKISFTEKVESIRDPGEGHQAHQIATLLQPAEGVVYSGRLGYSATVPVEVFFLSEIKPGEEPREIYTIDGVKKWALALIFLGDGNKGSESGTLSFVGAAALALHTLDGRAFTATVTVDAEASKEKELYPDEPEKVDISAAIKHKKKVSLIAIKNNGDYEIFGLQMKIDDGKIRYAKARGWDRDRIDQSTVILETSERPIKPGKSLIVILIVDNRTSSFEWRAFDLPGNMMARGEL